jgi:hypothetical protein
MTGHRAATGQPFRTLCEYAGELAADRLILTNMGPSMLTRLDDVEHDCAYDGLTLHT